MCPRFDSWWHHNRKAVKISLNCFFVFYVVALLCCGYTSTTQQNISQHVDNIYKDGELIVEATNKKFLLVRQEGNRKVKRNIDHYNLDIKNNFSK